MPSFINVSDSKNVCNELRPETCCFCGSTHFWKHGHYIRTGFYWLVLKNPPPEKKIQRYLCKASSCDRTFSALPEDVLPYCRFFFKDFLHLYENSLKGGSAYSLWKICHLMEVRLRTIVRLLSLFRKVLSLVQKWCREMDGTVTENLGYLSHFLVKKYSWFGFTVSFRQT